MKLIHNLIFYRTKNIVFGRVIIPQTIKYKEDYNLGFPYLKKSVEYLKSKDFVVCKKSEYDRRVTNVLTQDKLNLLFHKDCLPVDEGKFFFEPVYLGSTFFLEQKYVSKKQLVKQLHILNHETEEK